MSLDAARISITAGAKLIIDGVDCTVPNGTVSALIGPNGAGKSTLLRALAAIDRPEHGTVEFDGTDLAVHLDDDGHAALARLRSTLEAQAFAQEQTHPDAADLRQVLRSLRRDAGLAKRLAAMLLPRSLFAAWLPQPVEVEGD